MGAPIDRCDTAQTIAWIRDRISEGQGGWLITANLDQVRHFANGDLAVRSYFELADLVVADGMPLIWASRLAGHALPQRVAGSDLIDSVSAALAPDRRRVFLLGGNPGTGERAAAALMDRYEGLSVAGTHCPAFGFEDDPDGIDAIRRALLHANPDLVYVALGFPKQEHLIARLRLDFPTVWFIGVGISFSFVAGDVRRAPRWVQRLGLEWIHRLVQEPQRLFRRYVVQGLPFAGRLFAHSARTRLTRS